MTDDRVSIGEGFAFFRWHCLRWPSEPHCRGFGEKSAYCADDWKEGQRE